MTLISRAAAARSANLCAALLTGCTALVRPPTAPSRPTTIYLLQEAMHVGLVLTAPVPNDARASAPHYVEYGFGDWSWYALGADAWYDVFATVLWPTAGTLCRRVYAATDDRELHAVAAATGRTLAPLVVDEELVRALVADLDSAFAAAPEHAERADLGMAFARVGAGYWFPHTCADVAADWLLQLQCDVGWAPIRAALAVTGPEAAANPLPEPRGADRPRRALR